MKTCKAVHEFKDQNLAEPAAQTVQYEFEWDAECKKWV